MFAEERREQIMQMLQEKGRVEAKALAEHFQISIDSIRRDLSILEEQGLLRKTHGGAIPAGQVRQSPAPRELRYGEGTPNYNAIARHAASLIRAGDTVFIGSASIHYYMLKYLPDHIPFTVVTNSITVADALAGRDGVDTYLVGGKVKDSGNITDALATEFVRLFSIDLCFLTGSGITVNGISTTTPEVAVFNRTAAEMSRRIVLLAPHDRLGRDAFAKGGPLRRVELLITDEEAPDETIREFEALGVKVHVAAAL